jgi:hypothetical protein
MYAVEIASCGMVYISSFMEIAADVQTILRFSLSSLKAAMFGITSGRDLMLLKWA